MTSFDIIVLVLVGGSFLYALLKGATAMVLTILAWIGAIVVTLYGMPSASRLARTVIEPAMLADFIALPVLFIGSLFAFKLVADTVGRRVRRSPVGFLDRSIGAALGLLLGVVLVSSGYLFFSSIIAEKNHPDWVRDAQFKPLVSYGAAMVAKVGPDLFSGIEESETGRDLLDRLKETHEAGAATARDLSQAGYEELQRRLMDEKFEELLKERETAAPDSEDDNGG